MKIQISSEELSAVINTFGAELISLQSDIQREYIWEGNPEYWGKHSPVLFPIVGTLKNNKYYFEDKEYSLNRHGFARDMDFELVEKSDSKALFSLVSNSKTLENYPFKFELEILYELINKSLIIKYKVSNKSDSSMLFSIGAHPAFSLPNLFENYSLQFEFSEDLISYELQNDLLSNKTKKIPQTENRVALNYDLFEKDALIFKKLKSKMVTILENEEPFLRVNYNDFSSLGIWTKKNAPFICIEPWIGYSDLIDGSGVLSEKEGIQILEKEGFFECQFEIEVL